MNWMNHRRVRRNSSRPKLRRSNRLRLKPRRSPNSLQWPMVGQIGPIGECHTIMLSFPIQGQSRLRGCQARQKVLVPVEAATKAIWQPTIRPVLVCPGRALNKTGIALGHFQHRLCRQPQRVVPPQRQSPQRVEALSTLTSLKRQRNRQLSKMKCFPSNPPNREARARRAVRAHQSGLDCIKLGQQYGFSGLQKWRSPNRKRRRPKSPRRTMLVQPLTKRRSSARPP